MDLVIEGRAAAVTETITEQVSVTDVIVVFVCLTIIGTAAVKAVPAVRKVSKHLEALDGFTCLVERVEKATGDLDGLSQKVNRIHREVTPNGGGSMADALRRTEQRVNHIETRQTEEAKRTDERIIGVHRRLDRVLERRLDI